MKGIDLTIFVVLGADYIDVNVTPHNQSLFDTLYGTVR
jgi:hypothetical protein